VVVHKFMAAAACRRGSRGSRGLEVAPVWEHEESCWGEASAARDHTSKGLSGCLE
jgi:hypothetical protein